jgi:hypothetical protein
MFEVARRGEMTRRGGPQADRYTLQEHFQEAIRGFLLRETPFDQKTSVLKR